MALKSKQNGTHHQWAENRTNIPATIFGANLPRFKNRILCMIRSPGPMPESIVISGLAESDKGWGKTISGKDGLWRTDVAIKNNKE